MYVLCHFYTLKLMNFAQIYCFTTITHIILKFDDIESW